MSHRLLTKQTKPKAAAPAKPNAYVAVVWNTSSPAA
jgi:hypothetical protein